MNRNDQFPHHENLNLLANFRTDIPAGLAVFLISVPLALGIALASGAAQL
ncbi:MAG: hypothetical protein L0Y38_03785 [Methylococcaceae bacterium]|nr:hypothetical protein [Methylococcaceae bacterium]MCI0732929.1 hypothetical protein [Methylococcaceae bacterium]